MSISQADRMSSVPLMNLHERRNHTNNSNTAEPDYDWSDQEVEEFSRDPLESVLMQMRLWPQAISRQQCVQSSLFFSAIALCIGFVFAYLLFLFLYPVTSCKFISQADNTKITSQLSQSVKTEHVNEYLKINFNGDDAASIIEQKMKKNGLDNVIIDEQIVFLIEPDLSKANKVEIKDGREVSLFTTNYSNYSHLRFCPLSTESSAKGQFVYVNFGRLEDYQILRSNKIRIKNQIFLIRLSSIPVWEIVYIAKTNGASGLVLFSETNTFDLNHVEDTLLGFPSNIPIQPITWEDAKKIFKSMEGENAPSNWTLPGDVTVKLNSKYLGEKVLQIEVHNKWKNHTIRNVFGLIKGQIEPDRFVLIGSVRNLGKNSSYSIGLLLELTRVYGRLITHGKLDSRRSVVFCSFDSVHDEPLGVIKLLAKHSKWLPQNMITYINIDAILDGDSSIETWTIPSLLQFYNESVKKISNSNEILKQAKVLSNYLMVDTWRYQTSNFSDAAKRFLEIGVPVVDIHLKLANSKINENLNYLVAETRLIIQIVSCLTNSVILPFNIKDYISIFNDTVKMSQQHGDRKLVQDLIYSFRNFSLIAIDYQTNIDSMKVENPFEVRAVNDQMMSLEKLLSKLSSTDPCKINSNDFESLISCTTNRDDASSLEYRITKISSILKSATDILKSHF